MSRIEENIEKLVENWAKDNYVEFNEGGESEGKELYRPNIFKRCKRYENAPTAYLELWLKNLPELTKWYLNIFQIILSAGIIAVTTALTYLILDNFPLWIKEGYPDYLFVGWLIPLILLSLLLCSALKRNNKSNSTYLSNFIQTKLGILNNLKEILIESYYITKILEIRKKTIEP